MRIYSQTMVILALEQQSSTAEPAAAAADSSQPAATAAAAAADQSSSTAAAQAQPADNSANHGSGSSTVQRFRSTIIHLQQHERAIGKVVDFDFLHGYTRPTLMLLHEPRPVYVGRYAVGKDSCVASVFSINPYRQQTTELPPLVWSRDSLPSDTWAVLPLPLPLGGVVLLCTNCILHLDQANLSGLGLNRFCESSTNLQLQRHRDMRIAFDHGSAVALSDTQVLLALRTGEIHLLHLRAEGRLVEHFYLEHLHNSVQNSGMTLVGQDFVFLQSRLTNSLLLQLERQPGHFVNTASASMSGGASAASARTSARSGDEGPAAKRAALQNGQGSEMRGTSSSLAEDDDFDIYGEASTSTSGALAAASGPVADKSGNGPTSAAAFRWTVGALKLTVCDFLFNLAPITCTAAVSGGCCPRRFSSAVSNSQLFFLKYYSPPAATIPPTMSTQGYAEDEEETIRTGSRHQMDVVACTGHGKNSAISVIRNSVRPKVRSGSGAGDVLFNVSCWLSLIRRSDLLISTTRFGCGKIIMSTDSLQDCRDVWAVHGTLTKEEAEQASDASPFHSFVVLSKVIRELSEPPLRPGQQRSERRNRSSSHSSRSTSVAAWSLQMSSTIVLETSVALEELSESGFETDMRTIFAGNIGVRRHIVQVRLRGRIQIGTMQAALILFALAPFQLFFFFFWTLVRPICLTIGNSQADSPAG